MGLLAGETAAAGRAGEKEGRTKEEASSDIGWKMYRVVKGSGGGDKKRWGEEEEDSGIS